MRGLNMIYPFIETHIRCCIANESGQSDASMFGTSKYSKPTLLPSHSLHLPSSDHCTLFKRRV